ncbi:MAG TPA: DUF202 domain-containing protein [Rubricoccaceae bacterium]|jgi:uncharacterized membrane protein YidH (DUF202 family)
MRWRHLSPLSVPTTARAAARAAIRARARSRRAEAERRSAEAFALQRLILRDHLAVERTQMANERTVLSYLRTSFAFLAGALTLVNVYDTGASQLTAVGLAVASVALFGVGVWRFRTVSRRVHDFSLRGDPPASVLDAVPGSPAARAFSAATLDELATPSGATPDLSPTSPPRP